MQFFNYLVQLQTGMAIWVWSNSKAKLKLIDAIFKLPKDKPTPTKFCVSSQMIVTRAKRHLALVDIKFEFDKVFSSF